MGPPLGSGSGSIRVPEDNIPSSSQRPPRRPSAASLGNILNEDNSSNHASHGGSGASNSTGPGTHTPNSGSLPSGSGNGSKVLSGGTPASVGLGTGANSHRQSGSTNPSQQPVIYEGSIYEFLQTLADRTSGCSVEQLEQIYRELMDEIWKTRHEWNRMTVLNRLISVFNDTIGDIELVQGALVDSQKKGKEAVGGGEDGEVLDSVEGGGVEVGGSQNQSQSRSQSQSQSQENAVEEPWVYLK